MQGQKMEEEVDLPSVSEPPRRRQQHEKMSVFAPFFRRTAAVHCGNLEQERAEQGVTGPTRGCAEHFTAE